MKTRELVDILGMLGPAKRIAIGGMLLENRPSSLVRGLIRAGASDLFVTSAPAASWDLDVLIGAGLVSTMRVPHVSLGSLGLAPATRRAIESQQIVVEECDEAILLGGYLAAGSKAALQVLDHLGTNDVVDRNPLLVRRGELVGVAPLWVDVALLHAPVGDAKGNLVHFGSRWADLMIARAARTVIAQVDRVVSTEEAANLGISIPGYLIDHVVETPFGAHPLGSVGSYVADFAHLREYRDVVSRGDVAQYIENFCAVDHEDYLNQVGEGVLKRLAEAAS